MSAALIQQLDRFQGAHRYQGKTPLSELLFGVSVWRAPLIEEERRELLCQLHCNYGTKIASPQERLTEVQQWAHRVRQQQQQGEKAGGSGSGGSPTVASAQQQQQQQMDAGGDVLMVPIQPAAVEPHPLMQHVAQLYPGLSPQDQLVAFLNRGEQHLFTRTPADDYVDPTEFMSPIEPEQATSPLAAIVLSHHRMEHRGNPNMYLLWSLGQVVGSTTAVDTATMPSSLVELSDALTRLRWMGEDMVFCTITRLANSDTAFLAKPALNEHHTLLVTSKHIYSFYVTIVDTAPTTTTAAQTGSVKQPPLSLRATGGYTPRLANGPLLPPPAQQLLDGAMTNLGSSLLVGADAVGTTSSTDVSRLIASGANAAVDSHAPLYITDASEREKRVLLRQAILKGRRSGNGGIVAGPDAQLAAGSATPFTPPPPRGNGTPESPAYRRVHIFGTVETVTGSQQPSLFLRLEWQLPEGCIVETRSGATEKTAALTSDASSSSTVPLAPIVTQLAYPCHVINSEYQFDVLHVFNIPFELHVLIPVTQAKHVSMTCSAFSLGSSGREHPYPEGYASWWFTTSRPGTQRVTANFWKPRMTGYEYLKHLFLGGGPSLAEEASCVGSPPFTLSSSWAAGIRSRLGLLCESSGCVNGNYFVVVQECDEAASTAVAKGTTVHGQLRERIPSSDVAPDVKETAPPTVRVSHRSSSSSKRRNSDSEASAVRSQSKSRHHGQRHQQGADGGNAALANHGAIDARHQQ